MFSCILLNLFSHSISPFFFFFVASFFLSHLFARMDTFSLFHMSSFYCVERGSSPAYSIQYAAGFRPCPFNMKRNKVLKDNVCLKGIERYTVCPRNNDQFYIASYYIKWVTTLGTYSMTNCIVIRLLTVFLFS